MGYNQVIEADGKRDCSVVAPAFGESRLMIRIPELASKVSPDVGQRLLLAMGVFLIIFAARLSLINSFSTDVPYWDQWDAEAMNLYIPYFEGKLTWHHWFQPHNEHRITLTRLAMLVLLLANGQWDAQLQMVMNAIVYSGVGMMLFWVLMPDKAVRIFWGGAVVIIFSLPFGWENTLGGFQLPFYLMMGLSISTLWLLPRATFGTTRWYLGGVCALLSLFTLASGFLVCVVVLVIRIVEFMRDSLKPRRFDCVPTLVLCLCIVISGIFLKGHIPDHDVLQAQSIGRFVLASATNLSWPIQDMTFWVLLQWLPFVLYVGACLMKDERSHKMTFVIGLGLLVILQAAATAYARSGGSVTPSSRYTDILSIGVLVNLYAIIVMLTEHGKRIRQLIIWGFSFIWIVVNCIGFIECTNFNIAYDLPQKLYVQKASLENLRRYIRAGKRDLLSGTPNVDLPYPDSKRLALIIDTPEIFKILPPSLMPENHTGRLRTISNGMLSRSCIMFFCGLGCFLFGVIPQTNINLKKDSLTI